MHSMLDDQRVIPYHHGISDRTLFVGICTLDSYFSYAYARQTLI